MCTYGRGLEHQLTHTYGLASFILISYNLIAEQLKRKSLEQSGMVAATGTVHPHVSTQSDHQSPPRPTPPHLIYHLSRDIIILMHIIQIGRAHV